MLTDDPLLAEAGGLLGDVGPVTARGGEDPPLGGRGVRRGDAGVGVDRGFGHQE